MIDWLIHSPAPLAIASVLYLMQAYGYASRGDFGHTVAFVAYCIANVGFIIAWKANP